MTTKPFPSVGSASDTFPQWARDYLEALSNKENIEFYPKALKPCERCKLGKNKLYCYTCGRHVCGLHAQSYFYRADYMVWEQAISCPDCETGRTSTPRRPAFDFSDDTDERTGPRSHRHGPAQPRRLWS